MFNRLFDWDCPITWENGPEMDVPVTRSLTCTEVHFCFRWRPRGGKRFWHCSYVRLSIPIRLLTLKSSAYPHKPQLFLATLSWELLSYNWKNCPRRGWKFSLSFLCSYKELATKGKNSERHAQKMYLHELRGPKSFKYISRA